MQGLAPLAGLTALRKLGLSHTQITGAGLKHLRGLALEKLHLSSSPINDQGLAHLSAIVSLRDLALAYTDVTDSGLAHLESLGALRRLDLAGTDIGDKGLPQLGRMTGLTALLLNYTRITDAAMPHLEALEHLQELALIRTRITDKSMPIVGRFTELVDLNLDYTDVGDKGLEALGGLTNLQRLSLDSTNVTDASAKRLKEFRQLRKLNLYHTFITEKGHQQVREAVPECEIIFDPEIERSQTPTKLIGPAGRSNRKSRTQAGVAMVRSMMCWWLAWLGVASTSPIAAAEDDPAAEIAALGGRCSRNAAGETIGVDLSNTWVTDADLAKLARLPQLESINLAYTKITDQGLEHLAPLKNVKVLNLYYAESVTDQGIAHLKHWKNLEHLNLRGTKVTSSLFEHIAQHDEAPIPGCRPQPGQRRPLRAPGESRSSRASLIRRQQDERRRPAVSEVAARAQGVESFPASRGRTPVSGASR